MTLRLQPPARPNAVQIAIDVELQKIIRRVARPPRCLGFDTQEARRRQIKPTNESVDETYGIVGPDIVVNRLRKQKKLVTFESGDVSHA
jgi:hypothetical protein